MAQRAFPNNNNNQASNRNQHQTNSNPQISSRPKCSPWTTTKRSTKTPVGPSPFEAITTRAAPPVKVLACSTRAARPRKMNRGFRKGSPWSLNPHHHSIHKNKPVQIRRSQVARKSPIHTFVKECRRTVQWYRVTMVSRMIKTIVATYPVWWIYQTIQLWMIACSPGTENSISNKLLIQDNQTTLQFEEILLQLTIGQSLNRRRSCYRSVSWINHWIRYYSPTELLPQTPTRMPIQETNLAQNLKVEVEAVF